MAPEDHPASAYARAVVAGEIVAAPLVRAACERHLRDLETAGDRGLWFDADAADQFENFAGLFRHTVGKFAGRPLAFLPWQQFVFGSVYGWKREDGTRRFRTVYNQVAKKNGKTTMAALPIHYGLTLDREPAPQCLAAATSRDQANLLFNEVSRQAQSSDLAPIFDFRQYRILCPEIQGEFRVLTREPNSADGVNPHVAVADEVHRWRDGDLGRVIQNSMVMRDQPLYWMITTAGKDMNSYCGERRGYAEQVATGAVEDDGFFAFVAEPPRDADPGDRRTWEMANPSLYDAMPVERLEALWNDARQITGQLPDFKRYHCNLFTDGAEAWIDAETWAEGAEPFDLSILDGRECYAALDLSNTIDLSAYALAFPVGGAVYVLCRSFLAAGGRLGNIHERARRDKADYPAWTSQGWLEAHAGGAIDEDRILQRIRADADRYDIREFAYDRWGMASMKEHLKAAFSSRMVEHGQGYASMSAPMKRFEARAMQGTIRHGGDPVLARAVRNVHRDSDPAENIKPAKNKSLGRIDPAVAAIMAVGRADARKLRRGAGLVAI